MVDDLQTVKCSHSFREGWRQMGIISWIILGAVAGWIASAVNTSRNNRARWWCIGDLQINSYRRFRKGDDRWA